QAEALGVARECERAVADQAGAEQRRELEVGRSLGEREAEALVRHGELGIAAVPVVAGELPVIAEVLEACAAIAAGAVPRPQPPGADAPFLPAHVGGDHVAPGARQPSATIMGPGPGGGFGRVSSPSTIWRSVRQTAQARTCSSSSPAAASGSGISAARSGVRGASRSIARMTEP